MIWSRDLHIITRDPLNIHYNAIAYRVNNYSSITYYYNSLILVKICYEQVKLIH